MSTVSLDLQRRCEQRWAARFQRLAEPAATLEHRVKEDQQQAAAPSNANQSEGYLAGLRPRPVEA